jgi:hypothetical protein
MARIRDGTHLLVGRRRRRAPPRSSGSGRGGGRPWTRPRRSRRSRGACGRPRCSPTPPTTRRRAQRCPPSAPPAPKPGPSTRTSRLYFVGGGRRETRAPARRGGAEARGSWTGGGPSGKGAAPAVTSLQLVTVGYTVARGSTQVALRQRTGMGGGASRLRLVFYWLATGVAVLR